jgi:hypothetical protein
MIHRFISVLHVTVNKIYIGTAHVDCVVIKLIIAPIKILALLVAMFVLVVLVMLLLIIVMQFVL